MKKFKIKNICCIGAGYVGGPTMAVIAEKCPDIRVTVVDHNAARIDAWNSENLPIFEPDLDDIIKRVRGKNLFFTTSINEAIASADCVFISVNTPTKAYGHGKGRASDLSYLEKCTRTIASAAKGYTIVVEKSTLPVKSAETIRTVLESVGSEKRFDIISNPEFLAEGTAIENLRKPDRVLIGGENKDACKALSEVYANWVVAEKIITTNLWSSEMAKLAANAFLAQRVSSINSISAFCEATDADISQVANAIGADSRIGAKFLSAGIGFGGSCFKKDILNLVYLCEHHGLYEVADYWQQVVNINEWQKLRVARVVTKMLFNTVVGKRIGILGFAFKKNTNDTRESPAISVCQHLLEEGAILSIFDPKVDSASIKNSLKEGSTLGEIICFDNLYDACRFTDAIIVLTDWDEFGKIKWKDISCSMRKPGWVFDTRRCVRKDLVKEAGLNLWVLGSGVIKNK